MKNTLKTIILLTGMLLSLGQAAAQSKKEQIAALNNRVDSLYQVLSEERSDFTKALQTNEQTIQEQSLEILRLAQNFSEVSSALAGQTKSLENSRIKLQQARDSIGALSSELAAEQALGDCERVEIMRFDEFEPGVEWEGMLTCTRYAEYGWHDTMYLGWYWENPMDEPDLYPFDAFKLVPGEYYWVKFFMTYDMMGYYVWHALDVQPASDEDVSNWVRPGE